MLRKEDGKRVEKEDIWKKQTSKNTRTNKQKKLKIDKTKNYRTER